MDMNLLTQKSQEALTSAQSIAVPARVHTIVRLHSDLAVNYAGIALVLDLLARIEQLEQHRTIRLEGDTPWT